MKEQLTLNDLCCYLPFDLKFISELDKPENEYGTNPIWTFDGITYLFGDYCLSTKENQDAYPVHLCKPIFRNLATDLTRDIIDEITAKYPNVPNFKFLIADASRLKHWCNRGFKKSFVEWCVAEELQSRHFWLGDQSYFEKGIIIDYNDATTALNPKTEKCKCKFPLVRNDGKEYCGNCNEDI